MNQNRLYLIVGMLIVLVVGMGIYIWRDQQQPEGIQIRVNEQGISVEGK